MAWQTALMPLAKSASELCTLKNEGDATTRYPLKSILTPHFAGVVTYWMERLDYQNMENGECQVNIFNSRASSHST